MYQLDDLDHHHHLLLHRKRLVDLLHDLHDLRPIVNELLRFHIECAQVLLSFDFVALNEFIKKFEVESGGVTVKVQAKKFLDIRSLSLRNAFPRYDIKELNDRLEKFFTNAVSLRLQNK